MKISIITASYNYEEYIKHTIDSVLAQTYKDWELIIVDDGSQDNSRKIIESYCKEDNRIKLFTHKNNENMGLKDTLLLGIQKAKSHWIAFLESDDYLSPDYLEKKVKIAKENPDIKFIINDVNLIGSEDAKESFSKHFNIINKTLKSSLQPVDLSKVQLHKNHIVTFSVVMIKKSLIENLDFNSPVKPLLDDYLWSQILKDSKVYYIDEKLTNWRLHENSYIHNLIKNTDYKLIKEFNIKKRQFLYKKTSKLQDILSKPSFFLYKIQFIRKQYIKIHLTNKEIFLFGKWFRFH